MRLMLVDNEERLEVKKELGKKRKNQLKEKN